MNQLTNDQINLLKSRHVSRASIHTSGVTFDCLEGEWLVSNRGQHVDVFSFSRMNESEFEQTIHNIFHNTEKVIFQ